jgi:hypothetical protein
MNEIILASCDAGYVQSCTGLKISSRFDSKNETQILKGGLSLQIKLYRAVEKSLL